MALTGSCSGHEQAPYHFEFTRARGHVAGRAPTRGQPARLLFSRRRGLAVGPSGKCVKAGFEPVSAFNPYWDREGVTFEDPDGYRVVLQKAAWTR